VGATIISRSRWTNGHYRGTNEFLQSQYLRGTEIIGDSFTPCKPWAPPFTCHNGSMEESTSLWALFGSSFLAATLLPGGSEVVLFGILKYQPQLLWPALAVATAGNTLGGLSSYLIGRLIPQPEKPPSAKALHWVRRHGSPVLLLSWIPIVGDPLCAAAGWLRVNPWLAALFMALGKFARYLVIAATAT
jgi:membrane protein YqaA with SNARE-associated domain